MAEHQEQVADDAMATRIGLVVMLHHGGDREEARGRFLALWSEIGEDGDPFQRCALAHYLADTQDDPVDELAWDLRALSAAEELADRPPAAAGPSGRPVARALFPCLHLNLALDYDRLGRLEAARSHVRSARGAVSALGDGSEGGYRGHGTDAHGEGIRAAIARLERKLAGESP